MDLPLPSLLTQRETEGLNVSTSFQRKRHATHSLISRLGLERELEGHTGCVNCLEWSKDGRLLASGSDDCFVILWSPLKYRKLTSYRTHHTGNIFSVKFMPHSQNRLVATGAADSKVTLIDVEAGSTLHVFANHTSRVKRLAVADDEPHLLFSASEDGTVMQFDLRCPEVYSKESPRCVLVNLNYHMGLHAEAKCLSVNPVRTELMAVGCSDPYVRLYDRRMIRCNVANADSLDSSDDDLQYQIPGNSVRYFIPGHLPDRVAEYRRRYRMLAATYLTFSSDGRDLLVNLGGEQIYLYNINDETKSYKLETHDQDNECRSTSSGADKSNCGETAKSNGYHKQSYTPFTLTADCNTRGASSPSPLPTNVELVKQRANHNYERQNYSESIALYNKAICLLPTAAVLYSNRAAALFKRNWSGDVYAALNDCIRSIQLNQRQHKAFYRLCRCLISLNRVDEASVCFSHFERLFPDRTSNHAFESLRVDLNEKIAAKRKAASKEEDRKSSRDSDDECEDSASLDYTPTDAEDKDRTGPNLPEEDGAAQELVWQTNACDYSQRFCGHCNTTTDIKEANFIGADGQYICAGSDDGSFFIWDRWTTNIVKIIRGDECIVNCVQPHPEVCLLATSGIDQVVRLWSPLAEGVKHDRSIDNSHAAATLNQRRMNADPLEMMLMNMGHTISRRGESSDSEVEEVQCRPF